MDASTTGAKGSTSKLERGAGARRARVVQVLVMQGGLVVILLLMAWLARGDRRSMALDLATLIVPLGWGLAIWSAYRRDASARHEGRWSVEWAKTESRRTMGTLGALIVVWIALCVGAFLVL